MNADDLADAERRLLLHMRAMGGQLTAQLVPAERDAMGELVHRGLAEYDHGSGNIRRYVFTITGAALAEELAATR